MSPEWWPRFSSIAARAVSSAWWSATRPNTWQSRCRPSAQTGLSCIIKVNRRLSDRPTKVNPAKRVNKKPHGAVAVGFFYGREESGGGCGMSNEDNVIRELIGEITAL